MPAKTRTMPTAVLTEKQRDTLVLLAELAPHYRAETVPTTHSRLNMGTVRALERRNLVEFRKLPMIARMGVRLTQAGAQTADDLVKLHNATSSPQRGTPIGDTPQGALVVHPLGEVPPR